MHRTFFKLGSALAALAVVFGAFGAHLLKDHLAPDKLNSFQTGVQYQMLHSIAIIIAGLLYRHYGSKQLKRSGFAFLLGIVLFSGSIYTWILLEQFTSPAASFVIMVTPVGGLLFIAGWLFMFLSVPEGKLYRKHGGAEKTDEEGGQRPHHKH